MGCLKFQFFIFVDCICVDMLKVQFCCLHHCFGICLCAVPNYAKHLVSVMAVFYLALRTYCSSKPEPACSQDVGNPVVSYSVPLPPFTEWKLRWSMFFLWWGLPRLGGVAGVCNWKYCVLIKCSSWRNNTKKVTVFFFYSVRV